MKKRIFISLGIVVIIIIGVLIIFIRKNNQTITPNNNFIYMGIFRESIIDEENYVFTNYNDYHNKFNSNELTENDFNNHNYVLVSIRYDSCSESDITPTDYTIKGNNIDVMVKYKASCGVCATEYMYYLLKVDKSITSANVNITYEAINTIDCDSNISYKPLIYLYPQEETNVIVKLGYPELLTTSYPKYNDEWNIVAKPNGELIDKSGRTFYGLYWEGINHIQDNFNDGFVVSREETSSFLEEKLSILGLTEREANEFIIYWLPKLEENKYNLIRFENMDNINHQMPLNIKPTPDTLIRVFMEYKPLDNKIDIKEQELLSPNREGFTVVEWGGSLIIGNNQISN